MAKTILLFRHSTKDGAVKDTIGVNGMALARNQGMAVQVLAGFTIIDKIFHTKLVRTLQTAWAFMEGCGAEFEMTSLMPVISGLGSDEEFVPVCPDNVMKLTKDGTPHFQAMQKCLSAAEMGTWAAKGNKTVAGIFKQMKNDETALVVGHSPFVEFAVWGVAGALPEVCLNLPEMGGFKIVQRGGDINLVATFMPPA